MKILIGADIVPTQSNISLFSRGDLQGIMGKSLADKLKQADFRIFNLETPLSDKEAPIKKCGPNLIAPTSCIAGIKKLGVNLFTLANNHIMDHGKEGLYSTIKLLRENDIAFIGAGENISEAQKPYIIEKDGKKTGVYACAEHEFSIADKKICGANPFDPLESLDHIAKLKEECDFVIVLYHGGKEHYRYPSPYLQKVCRKICEKGADLVICQHSHCVGCREEYNGSEIVYGQGNFIFDKADNEYWNSALLVEVSIADKIEVEYIALEKKDGIVEITADESILNGFYERSEEIQKEEYVKERYSEFANAMFSSYITRIYGAGLIFRVLNKISGQRTKKKLDSKRKLAIRNLIECEAHRELFLEGIRDE